ncbi:MAG: hypothetical protein AAGJ81_12920 [Verrucomicrobiota bacterium]
MISWIQNTLEKKGRFIFILLLAVVIVSFVFVIGETPGCVSGEVGVSSRDYYGYDLNSESETRGLIQEVIVSSIVTRGQRPQNQQMLEQEILSRAALLHLADVAKIPEPSQEAFVQYLASIPFFQDSEGIFDPTRVTSFLDLTQLSRQFDEATIDRTLSNDYRIQQLMSAIAAPGFTLPFEIEEQARRTAATYDLSVATLSSDSVPAPTGPSEEDLNAFFEQRVEAYRIPETRLLSVVRFDPQKFAETSEEPTEDQIEEFFSNRRSDYIDPDAEDPALALPNLENVRDRVVSDWKAEQSQTVAGESSAEFVYALFDQEIDYGTPEFEQTVDAFSGDLEELPEMVGTTLPLNAGLPQSAQNEALRLDQIRYYSDPMSTDKDIVVLILREIVPSSIPTLDAVKEKVTADFRASAEQEAFVAKGTEVQKELSEKIAAGSTFSSAAETLGLSIESFTGASWEEIPEGMDSSILQRAESLPDGEVSSMVVTGDSGNFLFVSSRTAPELGPDSENYARTRDMLASSTARLYLSSFIGDLIQFGLAQADPSSR